MLAGVVAARHLFGNCVMLRSVMIPPKHSVVVDELRCVRIASNKNCLETVIE